MELNLTKQTVDCFDEIAYDIIRQEETLDCVVPDSLPDIAEVIIATGNVLIRSKDVSDGKIRLSANVDAKVMFVPDGEGAACCMSATVPFNIILENAEIDSYCAANCDLTLLSLDARMLNSRKVLVRAEVAAKISCFKPSSIELCAFSEDIDGIYTLSKQATLTPEVAVSEKSFVIADETSLPSSKPDAATILGLRTELFAEETKTLGSKIIVKGSAKCDVIYTSNYGEVCAAPIVTSFSQIIETDTECENAIIDLSLTLSACYVEIKSDSNGRNCDIELHVLAQYSMKDEAVVTYLADAYSNTKSLNAITEALTGGICKNQVVLSETIREAIDTPTPVSEIVDCGASVGTWSVSGDKVNVPVTVSLVYIGTDDALHSHRKRFDAVLTGSLSEGERFSVLSAACTSCLAAVGSDGAEIKATIDAPVNVMAAQSIEFIAGANVSDDEESPGETPSIVMIMASSKDDLWSIAKRYGSSIEAISEANGISDGSAWEKYILVPRAK